MKKKQRGKKTLKYVGYVAPWSLAGHISLSCTLNVLDKRYILHSTALRAVQAALTHTRHLLTTLRKGYRCLGEHVHIARRLTNRRNGIAECLRHRKVMSQSPAVKKTTAKVLRPHSESRPVCRHWYADCSQGHRTLAEPVREFQPQPQLWFLLEFCPMRHFCTKKKRHALR